MLAFRPQDIPLDVVYEDETLLVLNKPPRLVVHPGSGNWDGTLLNALAIGPSADLVLWLVPAPDGLLPRIGLFVAGLLLLAVATAFYIGAGFGTGARDGLMVGVSQRFGWPIWVARTVIEVTVVIVGWLLGGDVGAGTVIAAFAIGPMVQPLMPLFRRFPWSPERTRLAAATPAPGLEARVTS